MTEPATQTRPEPGGMAVITKAGALLDLLAARGALSPAAIADGLGEPRSSVYRLLASLENVGWVEPGPRRGSYRLGVKFIGLGSTVAHRLDVRRLAFPVMQRIHDATGETVFLCVRRDWQALCVERIDGARVQSLALRVGTSLPLHVGAAPRALLASEPTEVWQRYLDSGRLQHYTASTPADAAAVVRELRRTRADGVAVSDGDVTPGIAAVGAPVFDHRGYVTAALSISGVREVVLSERLDARGLVMNGAADISASLGYTPERTHLDATR